MVWLFPAATIALVAAAGPVIVHLLRRHQARRIVLPSVRFVVAAEQSAPRLKRVSDPALMIVRAAVIVAAVLGLARPLFLTDGRLARWSERIARVVIVDSRERSGATVSKEAIAAETSSADPSAVVKTADLRTAMSRGARWLSAAPPVRREIVVFSDFRRGSLDAAALAQVPDAIGVRLVRTNPDRIQQHANLRLLSGGEILEGDVRLEGSATRVSYSRRPLTLDGLRLEAAADEQIESLTGVVQSAGAFAPSSEQPLVIRFSKPAATTASSSRVSNNGLGWTLGAGMRFLERVEPFDVPVSADTKDGALVVEVDVDPRSLSAAQVLKSALDARPDPASLEAFETEAIPETTLRSWSHAPGPADPQQWRQTDESDGRWFWGLALLLLVIEGLMRRSRQPVSEVIVDAA